MIFYYEKKANENINSGINQYSSPLANLPQAKNGKTRKDFSKAERIDYARRLERIEELKAKERMSLGGQGKENFPNL